MSASFPVDVWTNHVFPFILPNVSLMRSRMGIVMWELSGMIYRKHVDKMLMLAECKRRALKLMWLTNTVVLVCAIPQCTLPRGSTPFTHLVHVSDHGFVHCTTLVNYEGRGLMRSREESVYEQMLGNMEWRFRHRRCDHHYQSLEQALAVGHVRCYCVLRYLTLHAIHNRRIE